MNRMRLKIAERLKDAQNTNAMLTTFNEIDMRFVIDEYHLSNFYYILTCFEYILCVFQCNHGIP